MRRMEGSLERRMLDFHSPVLDDQSWAAPILQKTGYLGSDGAFGTMFVWRKAYRTQLSQYGTFVMRRYGDRYGVPLGEGNFTQAIEELRKDAKERGIPFVLTGVTQDAKEKLIDLFPGKFTFEEDRDSADYLYRSEDLIHLSGKKYHGKRNHISKFQRQYSWSDEDLTDANMEECQALAKEWCVQNGCSEENGLDKEACALRESFVHFQDLGFTGGLIRVEEKPVAFTMGEAIHDQVYVVHFEKALSSYAGSYTMINREFATQRLSGYPYINREEDMGLEGLRKAKLSYYPAILLERFTARWEE